MSAADNDKPATGPESPTTARPLEMDDDDVQESGVLTTEEGQQKPAATGATGATTTSDEAPPPKPPRPMTEQQKNELILKEAFPSIDLSVIKAVLRASGGRIDPAFNALLEMTDPDAAKTEAEVEQPPPPPPRPVAGATPQSQLEADELYARQLAQHYENVGAYEARTSNRGPAYPPRPRKETGLKPNELYDDREHSFIDDDLPVIKESAVKAFQETQQKVNSWWSNMKKKIDEQFNEEDDRPQGSKGPFAGRPSGDSSRKSRDYERYDADPELLSDDFAGMKFHNDGTPVRQTQNPNLFKPPPPSASPKPSDGRKVAFRDGTEEIDAYNASPKVPPKDATAAAPSSAGKASKWQPLSTVDPSPIAENDPFSLGDSEDEKDAKDKGGSGGNKEIKMDDTERLRKAAAEAMNDSLVEDKAAEAAKK
ncbi:CUE domain-containing protein 5 [Pleurostoma richardsiae]|uniref:CUE domain-containing protein 5 n=1 Tax=Pleurostoma richardsiae TaxID=41990 RepID=A0AA38RKZ7_9PEZI|nr:CUE domain-containing protein 5 [Pleurostoma richardsiae]